MNIEKALKNYLNDKGPKIRVEDFYLYCNGNYNAIINVLFKLINDEIDEMKEYKNLDKIVEILKMIELLLGNNENINRKIIKRKVSRLIEKIPRFLSECGSRFNDIFSIETEFKKVLNELDNLLKLNEKKDTKQYDFMYYLMCEVKNVEYIEYTLRKMPNLVNVKDKSGKSLFKSVIDNYLKSVVEYNEEDIFYYGHLISLIVSQKKFLTTETERKNCLDDIYSYYNKISYNKKVKKKNALKVEAFDRIINIIKGIDKKNISISEISSKYNIKLFFDEDIIREAKLVKEASVGEMTDRVVIDDYVISMDKANTVEIDDALSCKKLPNGNYLLSVHVASVLGYFPYESLIVQEAISRNQAIYLPHKFQTKDNDFNRTIPIFPYDFCADKGSLKEGCPRLARSYIFEIDKNGNIVDEKFIKTIVTNNKRLTYDKANSILEKGSDDEMLLETLSNLKEVTEIIDKKYVTLDIYESIKETLEDISELRVKKIGSENIVYQAMLLTGNRVAEFFARKDLPLLYRVHYEDEIENDKLKAMIDILNSTYGGEQFNNLYQLIDGIYPKGWYSIEGRHEGLDLDHYCHCTSALRRAADIIVEHALEVCYDNEPSEEDIEKLKEDIAERVVEINSKQSPMEYFVREYKKKHKPVY